MKTFRQVAGLFVLLLMCFTVSSCSDDDDDEPNASGGGSTSGWVEIGSKKFNVKYGYYIDYGDGDVEITCSDTDLSDILNGKSYKKTISMIDFYYERYNGKLELDIEGGYKIFIDSENEGGETKEKDSVYFYWCDNSEYNPSGSKFNHDINGNTYIFEGSGLKAEAYLLDEYEDEIELGLRDFSLSVKTSPKDITSFIADMETRGVEMTVISDPQQKKIFRKYFGRK